MDQRHRESLFAAIEYFPRHAPSFCKFLENIFWLATTHFPPRRETRCPLRKRMVEERRSHFERGSHTHSIHFGQDVSGEIRFCIKILHFTQRIRSRIIHEVAPENFIRRWLFVSPRKKIL